MQTTYEHRITKAFTNDSVFGIKTFKAGTVLEETTTENKKVEYHYKEGNGLPFVIPSEFVGVFKKA